MKSSTLLGAIVAVGVGVAFQSSVNLQSTTPGLPQAGHSNITGTARAGTVIGYSPTLTRIAYGGDFRAVSDQGRGVLGNASSPSGVTYGGLFQSFSTTGRGVAGITPATSGFTVGGLFTSNSPNGKGVLASSNAGSGVGYGVYGRTLSPDGFGVFSEGNMSATGVISGNGSGLTELSASSITSGTLSELRLPVPITLSGVSSPHILSISNDSTTDDAAAIVGIAATISNRTYGVSGETGSIAGSGLKGVANSAGGSAHGVIGISASNFGAGVYGRSTATGNTTPAGVRGTTASISGNGIEGHAETFTGFANGVYGTAQNTVGYGISGLVLRGTLNAGAHGRSHADNGNGIIAEAPFGGSAYALWAKAPQGTGMYCQGALTVTGTKAFRIDHPNDPENKYLMHYCSEGPEPLNVYRGNIVTDARGFATVVLPSYFDEINRDPSYQLTVIDSSDDFVLAKVVEAAKDNSFRIRTNKPNVWVSWRVEAVCNDLYMRRYGAPVEVNKTDKDQGTYQHPELYGKPKEMGFGFNPRSPTSVFRPEVR